MKINNNMFQNIKYDYPETIGDFRFEKVLFPKYNHRSFKYALYKNKNKFAFAKIWQGGRKNFDYHSLVNEIEIYKRFNEIRKKVDLSFDEKSNIRVPELFFYSAQEDRIILLIEHIKGDSLKENDNASLIGYFDRVLFFLREISIFFYKSKHIKQKNLKTIPFLFVIFLIISTYKFPKQTVLFGKCFFFLCANFRFIYTLSELRLTHRSLEGQNLLLSDDYIYIIDFQLTTLSHPLLDLAQMFTFNPNKEFIKEMLNSKYVSDYYSDLASRKLLVLLTIYSCLTQLSLSRNLVFERINTIKYLLNKGFEN